MDWTSVYVESGEEDLLIPLLLEEHSTAPRLARFVSRLYNVTADEVEDGTFEVTHHRLFELFESHPSSSYTLMALYFLCINYILGVGCLGVPYAFARAGFVLATLVLIIVTLLSYMTVLWVAESGARLELILGEEAKQWQDQEASENTSLMQRRQSTQEHVHFDEARYEVVDLVSYYLGSVHKTIYQVALMALMYVGLLAYTQVFCGSIATLWVDEDRMLGIPQLIFAIMVVPLSCYDLDEQVAIQSLMATVRFVALFIMIGGSVLALWLDDGLSERSLPPYFAPADTEGCHMSYTACFSGFGVAFSTALFSQLFQHSVPGLLRPLHDQPRKIVQAPRIFGASLLTTFSFYLLLGTCAASYFGANTQSSVNLNFANFTFGLNPDETSLLVLSMLKIASNVVVMFPALDTISVFPLIANTLGNNLLAASGPAFLKWIAHHMISPPRNYSGVADLPPEVRKRLVQRASKIATIFWRLVAAFPPLIGSLWASDLSFSLLLAGVAGLYVAFFAPSLLQLSSSRMFKEETIFSGWYSGPILAYSVLLFGTVALGVVLLQIHDAWEMGKT